jgi:hypothetical protein
MTDGVGMPKGSKVAVPWDEPITGTHAAHVRIMRGNTRQLLNVNCVHKRVCSECIEFLISIHESAWTDATVVELPLGSESG